MRQEVVYLVPDLKDAVQHHQSVHLVEMGHDDIGSDVRTAPYSPLYERGDGFGWCFFICVFLFFYFLLLMAWVESVEYRHPSDYDSEYWHYHH